MKKFLLYFLALLPIQSLASVEESRDFVFENLDSLKNIFTFTVNELNILESNESGGDVLNVNDRPFVYSPVTIIFSKGGGHGGGAINKAGDTYSLSLRNGGKMTVSVPNDCYLTSVQFISAATGDIYLSADQPGDYNRVSKKWVSNGVETSQILLSNGSLDASIYKVRVTYVRPSIPLTLVSSTPNENEQVPSFSSMMVFYDYNITKVYSNKLVTIEGPGIEGIKNMTVGTPSGRSVQLSYSPKIEKDGQYKITIPEGTFENSDGGVNAKNTIKFKVYATRTTLNEWVENPKQGTYSSLPESITLTFPDDVMVNNDTTGILIFNSSIGEEKKYPVSFSRNATEKNVVTLTNSHGDINDDGECTIVVPEGAIHNSFYKLNNEEDRWNPEFNLLYTIERQEITEVKNARRLLAMSGIGYPAENSKARSSLKTIVEMFDNPETVWTDSLTNVMKDSIAAFYAEKEVELPANNQWYKIIGVNAGEDDNLKKSYLLMSGDSVALTKDDGKANCYKFLVRYDDDKVTFMASDSIHYLCVLSDKAYFPSNKKNVCSDEDSPVTKLTLPKLEVVDADTDADKEKKLGKLTIYGKLGVNSDLVDMGFSYSTINYATTTIFPVPITSQLFDGDISSAFIFEATDAPAPEDDFVEPQVELQPNSEIDKAGDELRLIIHHVKNAVLADKTKIHLFDNDNNEVTVSWDILSKHQGAAYEFDVNTIGLSVSGTYTLVMEEGTFLFEATDEDKAKGKSVKDIKLTVSFVIKNSSSTPTANFQKDYTDYSVLQVVLRNEQRITWLFDKDLNDLVIFSDVYSDLVPDPLKRVNVRRVYGGQEIVGYGHFEKYDDDEFRETYPEYYLPSYKAIKLIMDKPILEWSLDSYAGTYMYDIPEASFGDANFGKYLNNDPSVQDFDCHVNPQTYNPKFDVDNEKAAMATEISNISIDSVADKVVYDLQGRRVVNTLKKGVYIINGKKIVIK